MIMNERKNFLFFHIPKTAGQSVRDALCTRSFTFPQQVLWHAGRVSKRDFLGASPIGGHATLRRAQDHFTPAKFDAFFKFAFVRNPWGRLVSLYHFEKTRPNRPFYTLATTSTFEDYLFARFANGAPTQTKFIENHGGGIGVDFVGRFENIQDDFAEICRRIGIRPGLGHRNATKHSDFRKYYSDKSAEYVAQACAHEIALYDYTFDPAP